MSVISAINAKIEYQAYDSGTSAPTTGWETAVDCGGWTLDTEVDIASYVSCSTAGTKKKVVGPKDFKGTLTYLYNNAGQNLLSPSGVGMREGTYFWLKLWVDQSANPANAGGTHVDSFVLAPVVIKSVSIPVDIQSGDPVKYTINFEGNGELDFTDWA
jgi:hypothetical protein